MLKDENIDFVVIGEGELTFLKLIKYLETGNRSILYAIDGICFRDGNEIVTRPQKRFIEDLDSLPFPAYDLVDI